MRPSRLLFALGVALTLAAVVVAEPTEITVRVLAKDAKFIGSSMGGVLVTIKDADTGELLAQGVTQGSTGDTKRIMVDKRERGRALCTEDAGKWTATIDLEEPRRVEVTAYGPLAQRQSAGRVSATQWIVPGKHVTGGDAWLLEMPGLVVDVLSPPAHIKLSGVPQTIQLRANVTMMCGCPLAPDGLWDAKGFEIRAIVKRDGKGIGRIPMQYAGVPSQFEATYQADQPGVYDVVVYAYQPSTGNTGVDRVTWMVSQ